MSQLVTQIIGVGAGFAWAFPTSFVIFAVIKSSIGLRAREEEEVLGLDVSEHGMAAYGGPVTGDPLPSPSLS